MMEPFVEITWQMWSTPCFVVVWKRDIKTICFDIGPITLGLQWNPECIVCGKADVHPRQ